MAMIQNVLGGIASVNTPREAPRLERICKELGEIESVIAASISRLVALNDRVSGACAETCQNPCPPPPPPSPGLINVAEFSLQSIRTQLSSLSIEIGRLESVA